MELNGECRPPPLVMLLYSMRNFSTAESATIACFFLTASCNTHVNNANAVVANTINLNWRTHGVKRHITAMAANTEKRE